MNRTIIIKCTYCDTVFDNDEDLDRLEDANGFYLGCNICNTDSFLMDTYKNIMSFCTQGFPTDEDKY